MATKKKSKVVDISKKRGDKNKAREKKVKAAKQAAAPAQAGPQTSLLAWLVGEFRKQSVSLRMLTQVITERQGDVKGVQAKLQSEELTEEERTQLVQAEVQLHAELNQFAIQLHERAGIQWMAGHTLAVIDKRFAHPGTLPGLPSVREMPDLSNIDPLTVEEQQERIRQIEANKAAAAEARKASEAEAVDKPKKKKKAKQQVEEELVADDDEEEEEDVDTEDEPDDESGEEEDEDEGDEDEDEGDEDEED